MPGSHIKATFSFISYGNSRSSGLVTRAGISQCSQIPSSCQKNIVCLVISPGNIGPLIPRTCRARTRNFSGMETLSSAFYRAFSSQRHRERRMRRRSSARLSGRRLPHEMPSRMSAAADLSKRCSRSVGLNIPRSSSSASSQCSPLFLLQSSSLVSSLISSSTNSAFGMTSM